MTPILRTGFDDEVLAEVGIVDLRVDGPPATPPDPPPVELEQGYQVPLVEEVCASRAALADTMLVGAVVLISGTDYAERLRVDGLGDEVLRGRVAGRLGRLSGVTKRPAWIRRLTQIALPMGKGVVVIGGSLVGLELAEFLGARGRNVTLLHDGQQLGLPLAMPRRWAAVRHAKKYGVDIQRNVTVTHITDSVVAWTDRKGNAKSVPADMVIYADGTTAAAPLADALRAAGIDCEVIGDAGDVGYIHGAVHSAWKVATRG